MNRYPHATRYAEWAADHYPEKSAAAIGRQYATEGGGNSPAIVRHVTKTVLETRRIASRTPDRSTS